MSYLHISNERREIHSRRIDTLTAGSNTQNLTVGCTGISQRYGGSSFPSTCGILALWQRRGRTLVRSHTLRDPHQTLAKRLRIAKNARTRPDTTLRGERAITHCVRISRLSRGDVQVSSVGEVSCANCRKSRRDSAS